MNRSFDIWALTLLLVATAIIVASATFGPGIEIAEKGSADGFLGFWGGVIGGFIGGGMTLAAAWIAFGLTRTQVSIQASELQELQNEKAARATTLILMIITTATRIEVNNNNNINKCHPEAPQDLVSVHLFKSVPSIQEAIGYDEMWRLPQGAVEAVINLDISVEGFNGRLSKMQAREDFRAPKSAVSVDFDDVARKINELRSAIGV